MTGRKVVLALALAIAAVVALFAASELVAGPWLVERYPDLLLVAHPIPVLTAALVAAALVTWLILEASSPMLAEPSSAEARAEGPRAMRDERTAHYARWFVRMRWLAVLVAAGLGVALTTVIPLLPSEVRLPLVLTVVALAAVNAVYEVMLRRGHVGRMALPVQAYVDLGILALLLHFSGGIENPLSVFMLFHVIIAGVVLSAKHSYAVAVAGAALFAGVAVVELTGLVEHYALAVFPHPEHEGEVVHAAHDPLYVGSRIGLQTTILFLTAYFTSTLVERIRRDERRLEHFTSEVLEQRELLERALETTGSALCVCDGELGEVWANRRWASWFGPGALQSGVESPQSGCFGRLREGLEQGHSRVTEIKIPEAKGGSGGEPGVPPRTFRVTTAVLAEVGGEAGHRVALAQDITDEKRTEEGMIRAEQMAVVGELAGRLAHEVNNPMGIISAKARILLADHRSELSPKTAEELRKIVELSDRVARIAQGLLSYGRPATGVRAPVDIRVPVRKALAVVETAAVTAGVRVVERFPEGLPAVIGNSDELVQVFLNLAVNALDAMPCGGDLTVSAWKEGGGGADTPPQVAVVVEDTGMGIPEDVRDRLFEPFFTTKPEGKGTGLGLSICLGLVRSHGGEIQVESESGAGARVTVRLPAKPTGSGEG